CALPIYAVELRLRFALLLVGTANEDDLARTRDQPADPGAESLAGQEAHRVAAGDMAAVVIAATPDVDDRRAFVFEGAHLVGFQLPGRRGVAAEQRRARGVDGAHVGRSEEHTSELQSRFD